MERAWTDDSNNTNYSKLPKMNLHGFRNKATNYQPNSKFMGCLQ